MKRNMVVTLAALAMVVACADGNPTSPGASAGPEVFVPTLDDVANNLDASIDATAEVMALNVGGPAGTTTLYVTPRNDDGKQGCNLTSSTTVSVEVSSNNPGVATVSPPTATFTACSDTRTLTVTPVTAGTATITISQTSNTTAGTFNLAPATFTVTVAPPANSAPTVSVAGVTEGASYDKGSVPTATCDVTDAEDGPSSFAATLSAITGDYASDGIGSQTASCSYTDGGGLTASGSETYSIVDPSAPVIGYTLNPADPDGSNGWYTSDVTLTWNVSEPQSPNSLAKTGCVDQNITADQAETSYSCSATSAGGSATEVSVTIKRDATAPSVEGSRSPAANAHGWNNVAVTVSFTGSDDLSGIANCTAAETLSSEGANQPVTGTCTDEAGNVSAEATVTVQIDKTAPTIGGAATTLPNGAGWYNTNVTVHFTCADLLSGIADCTADQTLSSEGTGQSASGTAKDKADNSASATVSGINIDQTAPAVSVTGVTNGATYVLGSVPTAGCTTTDALSGVATSATLTSSGGPVGAVTATCSGAADIAGNTSSASVTYSVIYNWAGFFQPIDNNGVLNSVKAGSAVPVKFSLGGNQGLNIFAANYPASKLMTCDPAATVDVLEEVLTVTAGGSSLSYDATVAPSGQYVYVWKTDKTWAGTCRQLIVKLVDGTVHTANFKFMK
jgi:hypothetical protein